MTTTTEKRLRDGLARMTEAAPTAEQVRLRALTARQHQAALGSRGRPRGRQLIGIAAAAAFVVGTAIAVDGMDGAEPAPAPAGDPTPASPPREQPSRDHLLHEFAGVSSDRVQIRLPASFAEMDKIVSCGAGRVSITPLEPTAGDCSDLGRVDTVGLETVRDPDLSGYTRQTVEGHPVWVTEPVVDGEFTVVRVYVPLDDSRHTIRVRDAALAGAMADSIEILPPATKVPGVHGMDPEDLKRERQAARAGRS